VSSTAKRQPVPFGKYLLLDRINIGGMAEVWRGKTFGVSGFEKLVAIKRILPNIAEDEEFIAMFLDEAKISVQLAHANIAQIYDMDKVNNSYFIAMEYIPGKDMRAIFERCRKKGEPAPIPLSCYVISKVCEGLDYAHRKKDQIGRDMNIVHRDVSPQNVLISYEGEVKVIDFGIAKAAGKATKTQAGILKGKFGYMSPEQIRGLPLDRRSDVFAIGVCLYEMLTGERLFVGDSDFSVLEKVRKAEVTPPSTYNRRIPEQLEKIVLKTLARDLEARYQYASELADDLQRFLITSDSIFSRKDLMQYMKSTFAEEVEREKMRLQEYADIKPPEGMAAAAEMGFGAPPLAAAPPRASNPNVSIGKAMTPVGALPAMPGGPGKPPAATTTEPNMPSVKPADTLPPIRRPSLSPAIPKVTAAAPQSLRAEDTGSNNATQIAEPGFDANNKLENKLTRSRDKEKDRDREKERDRDRGRDKDQEPDTGPQVMAFQVDPEPATVPGAGLRKDKDQAAPAAEEGERPRGRTWEPPNMAPARVREGSLDDSQVGPAPEELLRLGARSRVAAIVAGVAALVVAIAVAVYVLWPVPTGYVLVEVSPAVPKARVQISDLDLGVVDSFPVLHKVKAGQAVLMVSAEGFQTFLKTVEIPKGAQPTTISVQLKRNVKTVKLLIATDPKDSEVRHDGAVVRAEGAEEVAAVEVPIGQEAPIEVRHRGYKTLLERISLPEGEEVVRRSVKLQPYEYQLSVSSDPPGAEVWSGNKKVGTTPLPMLKFTGAEIQKLVLRKKCFENAEILMDFPGDPARTIEVSRKLVKAPGPCR
jgi:serine/threonine protein kinase